MPNKESICRLNEPAQREVRRFLNRHKAMILTDLDDVDCPKVYTDSVISGINYLRLDLTKLDGKQERGGC